VVYLTLTYFENQTISTEERKGEKKEVNEELTMENAGPC
jgi:hypothetical protein